MPDDQKKILPINYTNRDFKTIREDLMDMAERFYPDTFQDFSEGSFGSLMLDAVSYVGDQLSFYLDYSVNESFLDTAFQFSNVVRHGRVLGYKFDGTPSVYGEVSLFVLVPASSTGIGPDLRYAPILRRGSTFSGDNNSSYILLENIDFSNPQNDVVVARVNDSTGAPTFYAIKATGNIVSGYYGVENINIDVVDPFINKLRIIYTLTIRCFNNVNASADNVYIALCYLKHTVLKRFYVLRTSIIGLKIVLYFGLFYCLYL